MQSNPSESLTEHPQAATTHPEPQTSVATEVNKPRIFAKILLAGAGLGLLANLLFYGRLPGISVLLFVVVGLAALWWIGRTAGVPLTWRGGWPAIPLVFLSGMVALRAAPFLSFLNIAASLVLLVALAYTYPGHNVLRLGFLDYLNQGVLATIEISVLRPFQALERAWKELIGHRGQLSQLGPVVRGLVLAAPVLVVFTVLFSAADAVFERLVSDAFAWLDLDNIPEIVFRLTFSAIVGWLVAGGLVYAMRGITDREKAAPGERKGWLGVVEAMVVLVSVSALFSVFVAVQIRYFFGGQANINLEGFTYSEYARRGFAELVIVAVLTLGLIFFLQASTARRTQQQNRLFEGLAGLLVGLTGVILVSAFQRMRLYEEAYGFTQLRFLVYVFIAWLAVLLAISLLTVHFDQPRWFATAVFVAAFGYVASLNILNMDAFIARQNVERFMMGEDFSTEGGGRYRKNVDAAYLVTLSDDAIPILLDAMKRLPPEELAILGSALHLRMNELDALARSDGWPQPGGTGWNYARWRAWTLLRAASPELQEYLPQKYDWEFPID
jgi:hypothetical protein